MLYEVITASISSALVNMGVTSSMKSLVDGVIVLVFLIYLSNKYKLELGRILRAKKAKALAAD